LATDPELNSTETARPFLPARDFALSKAFYQKLGFKTLLDGDVAIFGIGATSFILQDYFDENSSGHIMMQLMVDDLDAWWERIARLDLPATFGVDRPRPPALQPWGLRVAYVVDPSGVLWHVAQRREGRVSDR
jgi:catechol 2,3-dioxygenase-like lactoylglutathione lyase family enzyme